VKKKSPLPLFLSVSVLLAVADQIAKRIVVSNFRLGEHLVIIPGFFNLNYLRNRGGAFSLLAGLPPVWGRVFFIVATAGALAFVFYLYRYHPPSNRWSRLSLFLIFGGGLGNLVDRVFYGEVIDYILLYYRDFYWPAFNLADSCISVGVVLLAVDIFRDSGEDSGSEDSGGENSGSGESG
jgi:signal peptidase II